MQNTIVNENKENEVETAKKAMGLLKLLSKEDMKVFNEAQDYYHPEVLTGNKEEYKICKNVKEIM